MKCVFHRLLSRLEISDARLLERMVHAYWETFSKIVEPFPDVRYVLSQLQVKYDLGAMTNGLTSQQERILQSLGLRDFFRHVFTSESVGVDKSSESFYRRALVTAGYQPQDCAMVGNSIVNDIQNPSNIGVATIWYNTRDARQSPIASYTVHNFRQLLDVL